jgi:asparagine synthase (glutamine-hydrolysing)
MAERWVPREIAWRKKVMFRAPMDTFHLEGAPAFVDQLLSREALQATGYFDVDAVQKWRAALPNMRARSAKRTAVEMGLVGVTATQLWHQTYIDSSLAEVPGVRSQGSGIIGLEAQRMAAA